MAIMEEAGDAMPVSSRTYPYRSCTSTRSTMLRKMMRTNPKYMYVDMLRLFTSAKLTLSTNVSSWLRANLYKHKFHEFRYSLCQRFPCEESLDQGSEVHSDSYESYRSYPYIVHEMLNSQFCCDTKATAGLPALCYQSLY